MEFLRDILEEHLEEAGFLYLQRRSALEDDAYDPDDLAALEERLLAHIDGLVVAGAEAWELLAPRLASSAEDEAFVAGLTALATGDVGRRDQLLAAFGMASAETLSGLRAAFCARGLGDLAEPLKDLLSHAEPAVAAAVLEILAFHRQGLTPRDITTALAGAEPVTQAAGLAAAAAMGWREFAASAAGFLTAEDPQLVAAAVRAGFILGDDRGLERCRALLAGGDPSCAPLQIWLGLAGHVEDAGLLAAGLDAAGRDRGAVIALGWLGRPEAVNGLLRRLERPGLDRQIAAAVRRLTGVDLAAAGLVLPEAGLAPAPEVIDDDGAEFGLDDPDAFLPRPDPSKLIAWWKAHGGEFRGGRRLRYGRPLDREALLGILRSGGLAERHLAACELARLSPGQTLPGTRSYCR